MGKKSKIDPKRLDPTRRRIWNLVAEKAGGEMARASRDAGMNEKYFADYFGRGNPSELPEKVRERLASAWGIQPEMLRPTWTGGTMDNNKRLFAETDKGVASSAGHHKNLYQALAEQVPTIGAVQAGVWVLSYLLSKPEGVTMQRDSRYPGVSRQGLRNIGPSMNLACPDGGMWIFAHLEELRRIGRTLRHGDYVVIERRKSDGGGDLIEATVRRYKLDEGGVPWLWHESTDPMFQTPISLSNDDVNPKIIGIVTQIVKDV